MKLKSLLTTLMLVLTMGVFAQAPENWILDLYNPGDGEVNPNTEFYTDGTQSAEVTIFTDGVPYLDSYEFAVTPGDSYTFSIDVLENDPGMYFKLYADFRDAEGNEIWGEEPVVVEDSPEWQTITWAATVPDDAAVGYIRIKSYDDEGFTGEASGIVDNCHFDVDGSNLVLNGSFEQWGGVDMVKAYAISETELYVLFDGDVPTTNAGDFLLTGTEEIAFGDAAIAPGMNNVLMLSGASANMMADMTLDMLTYNVSGTMFEFYAGILPIAYLNTNNPDGHIENDFMATFQGIIFANDAYNNLWINDAEGAYNGVMVFSYDLAETLNMGDEIIVAGKRDEYYDNTEIGEPTLVEIVSSGNDLFPASMIMGADIADDLLSGAESAEKWEGQLCKIVNATVLDFDEENMIYTCTDDDGATNFLIGDNVDYLFGNLNITIGGIYSITGVVDFGFDQYRINPRFQDDLTETSSIGDIENTMVNIFPNPASDVLQIHAKADIQSLQISDASGKVIYSGSNLDNEISMSISHFRTGIYFISLTDTDNTTWSKKIMIR